VNCRKVDIGKTTPFQIRSRVGSACPCPAKMLRGVRKPRVETNAFGLTDEIVNHNRARGSPWPSVSSMDSQLAAPTCAPLQLWRMWLRAPAVCHESCSTALPPDPRAATAKLVNERTAVAAVLCMPYRL
jgi:hypothetical protein